MNSMSKGYYEDEYTCKKERECDRRRRDRNDDCCKKERKECPTIIKCGCPNATTIPVAAAGDTFTVASFTLDTSCLCDPTIKLEFASNLVTTGFTGAVSLQVVKLCGNQITPIPVGPAWTYSRAAATTASETFTFFICDGDTCHKDCCTYTVIATVVSAVTVGTLAINNATLGAIATCKGNKCC